jgi:hypothetical protein
MTKRYENIVEAYETFERAFKDSKKGQPCWSKFSQWLKSGGGVYWINGKAGSRKSTLIRHIFDDPRTSRYLRSWARSQTGADCESAPLCLATFFFWNSGTADQKSQLGLMRGLLFQIPTDCPNLVPLIFPDYWVKLCSTFVTNGFDGWEHQELQ